MPARIGIDVDGVLARTVPSVLDRMREKYGSHDARKEDITQWNSSVEIDGEEIYIGPEIVEGHGVKEHVRSIKPKQGAREGLEGLRRMGYELVIVTNRPSDEETVRWSRAWLKDNSLPYDEFHSTAETSKTSVDVDVLIDDHDRNVLEFLEDGRPAVLFDQPWNNTPIEANGADERLRVVSDWTEATEALDSLV